MRPRWLTILPLAAAIGLHTACSPTTEQDYTTKIASERSTKDDYLRQKDDVILPPDRDKFLPLSYFPIDENYAVPAQLQQLPAREPVEMPTSTGTVDPMERVGTLVFNLKGQALKLTAFVPAGTARITRLFVPFSDLTSGTETYQAGRYMDLDPTPTGIYIVDFNVAYHPYCYYNPSYICPIPPKENRLSVPVRAGERLRKADATVSQ